VENQLGRAELPGFELVDLPVDITYGSVAGIGVDIAFAFESRITVPGGAYVHVLGANALLAFHCGNWRKGYLNSLSLGPLRSCKSTNDPWSITIQLAQTLTKGSHVFTVPAQTPNIPPQPADNIFEVYIRDAAGNNRDVALSLPGEKLLIGLRMVVWPLWWQQVPKHQTSVQVSVPLEIMDDANIMVTQILISLPMEPDMEHMVYDQSNMQISSGGGRSFPMIGLRIPSRNSLLLRLRFDEKLKEGLYTIRFQVQVPQKPPALDLWRVAICGSGAQPTLQDPSLDCTLKGMGRNARGSDVLTVFALPGFDASTKPGNPAQSIAVSVTAASRRTQSPGVTLFLFFLGIACM
jgi:hypothetical protein